MQIKNIVEQKPEWTGVNIVLTPREAYLLALVLGSTSLEEKRQVVKARVNTPPRSTVPETVLGNYTDKDELFLLNAYAAFMDALCARK